MANKILTTAGNGFRAACQRARVLFQAVDDILKTLVHATFFLAGRDVGRLAAYAPERLGVRDSGPGSRGSRKRTFVG